METNTKAAPARKITHGISFPNAGERDAAKARAGLPPRQPFAIGGAR